MSTLLATWQPPQLPSHPAPLATWQVVSGLVKFIAIEAMADRRVVVVANMKATKLKVPHTST
jgi:tRNA-binding EMAP/Myf-like protein